MEDSMWRVIPVEFFLQARELTSLVLRKFANVP